MSLIPYTYEAGIWRGEEFLRQGPLLLDAAHLPLSGEESEGIDVRVGFSYRLQVGSAFLGIYDADQETRIFARGNVKPFEGSDKRLCSERINLGRLRNTHFQVGGVALVSSGDTRDITSIEGAESTTVLPCNKTCLPMLSASPRVDRDIPIITRDSEDRKSQCFTLSQLITAHAEDTSALLGNTVSEFRFYYALQAFQSLAKKALKLSNRPEPAELVIEALLTTAR